MTNTINIGRKDVLWSYAATFLQIGMGVILLPFILPLMLENRFNTFTINFLRQSLMLSKVAFASTPYISDLTFG